MAKKKMNGIIYKLFRNYGFIKSSEGKILPFEFTKEMIICDKEGNQFIRTDVKSSFYNSKRIHQSLGYLTPNQFEKVSA
ncbi:Transposase [Streptococcus infantarius subsp. infantarius]|nr:Transposase [Streptococcus infantarius subsp. infantarius]